MRLMATEDDIYKMMDQRDYYIAGAVFCGIVALISIYLLDKGLWCWDILYLLMVSILGTILFALQILKVNHKIMGAGNCYLELDQKCLVVRQPEKNGHYEACRIFYEEIEKIVEGSRRGSPEFYVVIKATENDRESFILLDEEEQDRMIFCVHSLGYEKEAFIRFYRKLLWEVPGRVRVFGTKHQEIWKMKKAHMGICVVCGMLIIYIIPKIIEIMKLI